MHDGRNVVLALLLGGVALWGLLAWVAAPELWARAGLSLLAHRVTPVAAMPVLVVWLWCELVFRVEGRR